MEKEKMNKWVIKKMNSRNWSMRELGRQADTSQSYISRVLSGKIDAGFEFYLNLARAFDAVPEFLRIADILPDENEEGALFSEILAAMKALTVEEREEVLQYVFFVKEKGEKKRGLGREATAPT